MSANMRTAAIRVAIVLPILSIFLGTTWDGDDAATTTLVGTITGIKNPADVAVGNGVARIDHNDEFGAVVNVGDNSVTIFEIGVVLARRSESAASTVVAEPQTA